MCILFKAFIYVEYTLIDTMHHKYILYLDTKNSRVFIPVLEGASRAAP